MQEILLYVSANSTVGKVRDYANAQNADLPAIVKGVSVAFRIRLFANAEGTENLPVSMFSDAVSYEFVFDNDFSEATSHKLVADASGITISEITESVDGENITYTELYVPVPETNTEELAAWLGTDKEKSGLVAEFVAYNNAADPVFVLQIEGFSVRNRVTSAGNPTPVDPDYLTSAQVYALVRAENVYQFSENGTTNWHDTYASTDLFYRERKNIVNSAWGAALPLGRTGVVVDNINYSFTTTAGQDAAITFTKDTLGIASDSEPQISLWSVSSVKTQINTASFTAAWSSDSLTITYYQTWAAGNWIIKMS